MNSGRRSRRSWLHLLGAYSTCLYSIGSSAACQQSASRLKCENCETQRKRGEQESSRGHKFSILENSCPFGTASCWGVPAPNPARNEYSKLEFIAFVYQRILACCHHQFQMYYFQFVYKHFLFPHEYKE